MHKGFYTVWSSIKGTVFSHVASAIAACPTCTTLRVTGHSLGAALGTFAALELSSTYELEVSAWTTGSPRVGDATFANAYNAAVPNTQRMVANDDQVAHLPLKTQGFTHVATEIWDRTVNGVPTYKVCNGGMCGLVWCGCGQQRAGEDPTCSDSVGMFQWSVEDHMFYAVWLCWICGCADVCMQGIEKVDC